MFHITFPVNERRAADRCADPACHTCHCAEVTAVLRTSMVVYFRCNSCNRVWGVPKPLASKPLRDALEALG